MQIDTVYVVQTGDIALTRSSRSIRDGEDVKVAKEGTEIMRGQPNGSWLFVIDHPYSAEPKTAKDGRHPFNIAADMPRCRKPYGRRHG